MSCISLDSPQPARQLCDCCPTLSLCLAKYQQRAQYKPVLHIYPSAPRGLGYLVSRVEARDRLPHPIHETYPLSCMRARAKAAHPETLSDINLFHDPCFACFSFFLGRLPVNFARCSVQSFIVTFDVLSVSETLLFINLIVVAATERSTRRLAGKTIH